MKKAQLRIKTNISPYLSFCLVDADTTIPLPCISIKFHNVLYSRAMTAKKYAKSLLRVQGRTLCSSSLEAPRRVLDMRRFR